jgi:hypothetical protein
MGPAFGSVSDLRLCVGAGDENRTRTISLGSTATTAANGLDLPVQMSASGRGYPLVTLANGPLMARRSCTDPQHTGVARTVVRALLLPRHPRNCPPLTVATMSRLAERPASAGLALTRRTRPRQSSGEEDGITGLEGRWCRNRPARSDFPASRPRPSARE